MTRKTCLFVLPSLRGGGAEHVVTMLLRHLDTTTFQLHLALVDSSGPNIKSVASHITVHNLNAGRISRSIIPLTRLVYRLKPHVVVSTMLHMNLATALSRTLWPRGIKLVVRETNLVQRTLGNTRLAPLWRAAYRLLYRQADIVVCQTRCMQAEVQQTLGIGTSNAVVIRNPLDLDAIHASLPHEPRPMQGEGPHVVALGRLRRVKGTDRLLTAFPKLIARHPAASLWLLGDGPCEAELRGLAQSLDIQDHVHFMGYQQNPYQWLKAAHLMAVTSHAESSSNAILEAVACGCPTVALEHPGGTREMLTGLGLADRFITRLETWDEDWFRQLPDTAIAQVGQTYNVHKVVAQYAQILQSTV